MDTSQAEAHEMLLTAVAHIVAGDLDRTCGQMTAALAAAAYLSGKTPGQILEETAPLIREMDETWESQVRPELERVFGFVRSGLDNGVDDLGGRW